MKKAIFVFLICTIFILNFARITEAQPVGSFGIVPPVGEDLKVTIQWQDGSSNTYDKGDTLPTDLSLAIKLWIGNSVCNYSHIDPWLGTKIVCENKLGGETIELFIASVMELEYPDEYQMFDFDAQTWTFKNVSWVGDGVKCHFNTTGFPVPYVEFFLNESAEKLKIGYTLNEVSYTETTTETALRFQLFAKRVRFQDKDGNNRDHEDQGNWEAVLSDPTFKLNNMSGFDLLEEPAVNHTWIKRAANKIWIIAGFGRGFGAKVIDPSFGYETKGGAASSWGNRIWGSKYQITEDGTGDSITVYIKRTSGTVKVKCAVYEDSAGSPSNLLTNGETEERELTGPFDDWHVFNFPTSPSFSANTDYWLCAWSNDSVAYYYDSGDTDQTAYKDVTYDGWPDPFGTPTGTLARKYSIFCNYSTGVLIEREVTLTLDTGWVATRIQTLGRGVTLTLSSSWSADRVLIFPRAATLTLTTSWAGTRQVTYLANPVLTLTTSWVATWPVPAVGMDFTLFAILLIIPLGVGVASLKLLLIVSMLCGFFLFIYGAWLGANPYLNTGYYFDSGTETWLINVDTIPMTPWSQVIICLCGIMLIAASMGGMLRE